MSVHYFGKVKPFLDGEGRVMEDSISEKVFLDINHSRQGMIIKGRNINNPIILVLHGGMPEYFLTKRYPLNIEDDFTVVWWDQRGAGLSNNSKKGKEVISLELLMDDTLAVTKYLLERFGKEKIYLLGHSGGSFLGVHVAQRNPELYFAYIGIAQMSYQIKSEIIALEYMKAEYNKIKDEKMLKKLENIVIQEQEEVPKEYIQIRDVAMHRLGIGTTHKMKNIITEIFLETLFFPEYTIKEKLAFWVGKSKSGISVLWNEMIKQDLSLKVTNFKIPIYFLHGKYDYTCSYELSKSYFYVIDAPVKGFYTFENSAHSPHFEEPNQFKEILLNDVCNNRTQMSDK